MTQTNLQLTFKKKNQRLTTSDPNTTQENTYTRSLQRQRNETVKNEWVFAQRQTAAGAAAQQLSCNENSFYGAMSPITTRNAIRTRMTTPRGPPPPGAGPVYFSAESLNSLIHCTRVLWEGVLVSRLICVLGLLV